MGRIGCEIARRARYGFGMNVLYHNRRPDKDAESKFDAQYMENLHDLLHQSDYVVLSCPLTKETTNLIDAKALSLMKSTGILVNVARGGVVDTDALLNALESRAIYGAGLDVTEPEPLPRDHRLLKLDNVVIMPHLGSATVQTRRAMAELSVENLLLGLDGNGLKCQVKI
uniref:D-isomer specific 2-hydroxyacid dehydrogenase NAD-binding domain-containing protein n=1 Tax=Ditylum brightwellii TaxID=49249 RepID=A0A7S4W0K5_9STRA